MFARLPPDPPRECQVVSTSAYSVRLAWAPAFSADEHVTYNIRYRIKFVYYVIAQSSKRHDDVTVLLSHLHAIS